MYLPRAVNQVLVMQRSKDHGESILVVALELVSVPLSVTRPFDSADPVVFEVSVTNCCAVWSPRADCSHFQHACSWVIVTFLSVCTCSLMESSWWPLTHKPIFQLGLYDSAQFSGTSLEWITIALRPHSGWSWKTVENKIFPVSRTPYFLLFLKEEWFLELEAETTIWLGLLMPQGEWGVTTLVGGVDSDYSGEIGCSYMMNSWRGVKAPT